MPNVLDGIRWLDGAALRESLPLREAVAAIRSAVPRVGPESGLRRTVAETTSGQVLFMPAELDGYVGCKLLTLAPGNPARGLPRIQGAFFLFDGATLNPVAMVDGTALTILRTPAVSAAMADLVTPPDAATLGVFGTGPQAVGHVHAMRAIRPIERVRVVGSTRDKGEAAASALRDAGIDAQATTAAEAVRSDLVVCATSTATPLFDDVAVEERTTLVAVGSHEPDKRELPGRLLGSSQVIVESVDVATTEAGDVIQAVGEGHLAVEDLVTFRSIADGSVPASTDRPRVIKTCGMGWQDLAIAMAAYEATAAHEATAYERAPQGGTGDDQ